MPTATQLKKIRNCEPLKQRNLFYVMTGWYPEHESVDEYSTIDKAAAMCLPGPEDPHQRAIQTVFEEAMRRVNMHNFSFRCVLGCEIELKFKPFSTLQSEVTIVSYANLLTKPVSRNTRQFQLIDVDSKVTRLADELFCNVTTDKGKNLCSIFWPRSQRPATKVLQSFPCFFASAAYCRVRVTVRVRSLIGIPPTTPAKW